MRQAVVDTVLTLILLTFPQTIFTQVTRPQECGEEKINVDSTPKEFKIPYNSDKGFKQATTCTYQLSSKADTRIILNITSLHIGRGGNCDSNYIKFSDTLNGIKTAQPFCGNKAPSRAFVSQKNEAFVEFTVQEELPESFVKGTLLAQQIFDPACGPSALTLQSESAELKIPVDGKKFASQAFCFYEIKGNDDKKLQLQITHLKLGLDGQCNEDFIKVSQSRESLQNTNYSYCGTKPPEAKFVSNSNQLFIAVATTTDYQQTSIRATYSKVNFVSKLESSTTIVLLLLALVVMC